MKSGTWDASQFTKPGVLQYPHCYRPWAAVEISRVCTWIFPAWCLLAVALQHRTTYKGLGMSFASSSWKACTHWTLPMAALHSYNLFSDNLCLSHWDRLRAELPTCGPLFYMPQKWTCLDKVVSLIHNLGGVPAHGRAGETRWSLRSIPAS